LTPREERRRLSPPKTDQSRPNRRQNDSRPFDPIILERKFTVSGGLLIDSAQREIDIAAYVLTDWPVIQALTRAADRGVKVRIYHDGGRLGGTEGSKLSQSLAETPSVDRMHAQNFSIAAPNSVEHSNNSSSASRIVPNG
jgi:phosphatidylserine/phosphatidylglycerophosphate/cardiolipin synthase-like enzyme